MSSPTPDPDLKPDWALTRKERRAQERAAAGLPPRRRRLWPWLVLLALIAAGGWWYLNGGAAVVQQQLAAVRPPAGEPAAAPEPEPAAAAPQVMQLTRSELYEVQPATLRDTVRVTGSLAPQRQLRISAEVPGKVAEVSVKAGDRVILGQVLVQIEVQTLQNQLAQLRATSEATKAQLRLAQAQLERTRSLVERGLSPPSELEAGLASVDQISASLNAQEAQIVQAGRQLGDATIMAPFDGVVAARSVDPGSYVTATAPLMTLVDLSRLEFNATLPVGYAPRVAPGQRVELTVEGLEGRTFEGAVGRISPVAAEGTRMLPIYVELENQDQLLRGGMFASGRLVLEQKPDALGVPVEALREDAAGTYVLKRVGELVQRQGVTVAREWDGGRIAEIAAGLSPGDVIVALPLATLRPGAKVQLVD